MPIDVVDYDELIDADTWKFIRDTERFYPPDTFQKNIVEQRRLYDAMCREFYHGRPDGVSVRDIQFRGTRLRIYQADCERPATTVLYAHGGSLSLGGLDSHDDICAEICGETGLDVVAVDYRLLPENSHEDALEDVVSGLDWIRKYQGHNVVMAGDSAGGFLVASVTHANRRRADIVAQVLIYPALADARDSSSMEKHAHAPLLTSAEVIRSRGSMARVTDPKTSTFVTPLSDTAFTDLPLTVAISAECDPISDDARDYVTAIKQAGGAAIWVEDQGLVHGHLRARHRVKRARESFDRVLRAISSNGKSEGVTRVDLDF